MKKLIVILFFILAAPVTFASHPLINREGIDLAQRGEMLFEKMCDKCHTLGRSLKKNKDLEAWKRTALRMARYADGVFTEAEALEIAEYLAARDIRDIKEKPEAVAKLAEQEKGGSEAEEFGMFDFKKVRTDQFIEPEVCEGCHSKIFEMWNGSMHSKAFVDPLWRAATKLFVKEAVSPGEILEMKACVKCHTPLGFRSYTITSPESDYDKVPELPARGIFCNWCHNISLVKHIGDAGYEVEPGGGEDDPSTMLGPFKDSTSDFHPTKYSELHTRSEFCGLCHNVSHAENKLPIEATYDEWKNSPYNTGNPETTVNCQDCHMRQRPGIPSTGKTERPDNPGKACDYGPDRKHIWTHYFVGGNAIITKLLGSNIHSQMAVERLKHAADLEIIKSKTYGKNGLSSVKIKVINSGAGHYLPTGLTEVRQMWLDVSIADAQGKTLLRSGSVDETGKIEENTVIFNTVLGNNKGEPVLNVAKADRVLYDHRVPPKGHVIENYSFYIPSNAVSPLKVKVSLNYRSASQELANALLGDDAPEIPVIEMVTLSDEIAF
jgi:mono/diheme cytochrome c family protein